MAVINAIKKTIKWFHNKDIKAMQEKYGAHQEKNIKVIMPDIKRSVVFRVENGSVGYMWKGSDEFEAEIEAYMHTDTLLNLLAGRLKVLDHMTKEMKYKPYRFFDAIRYGDVKVYGEAASNDAQLAMRVFDDGLQEMQAELFPEIQEKIEEGVG